MIRNGDVIGVGVSGGKDSMVLLYGLHLLSRFIGIDYKVMGITVDPGFSGVPGDYSAVTDFCSSHEIPYHVIPTQIGEIVFDIRREKNPCSMCAHLRRGALQNAAAELGCTKLALGHNLDDTAETFIMNLFNEGRIGCYSPVTELEDKGLIMIRPGHGSGEGGAKGCTTCRAAHCEVSLSCRRTYKPSADKGVPCGHGAQGSWL